jgi:hypothetical protein
MGRPSRRRRSNSNDPAVLAERLPLGLRTFQPSTHPDDYRRHVRRVADWLYAEMPAAGDLSELASAVMSAAGLSMSVWYRMALAQPAPGWTRGSHEATDAGGPVSLVEPLPAPLPQNEVKVNEEATQPPERPSEPLGGDGPVVVQMYPRLAR